MVVYFLSLECGRFCVYARLKTAILLVGLLLNCLSVNAMPLDIVQISAFLNTTELGSDSLQQDQPGSFGFTEIQDAGLSINFNNQLNANNLGTFSWQIQNTLGIDLTNVSFFAFLDMEIDESLNTFFNESGALENVSGLGAGDILADSWEIDEPGFTFGDIFTNLLAGSLDNFNALPAVLGGLGEDVSLALGFEIGSLLVGETLSANFIISESNIGGLSHTDPDSNSTFFFNGTAEVFPVSATVPEPGTLALIALSLLLVSAKRFKLNNIG